jgi:aquaporin Z
MAMRKYVVEFIGTFFLVLTVCGAVRSGSVVAPVAIGGVLAAMIFAGGHISGGHFNPAVSLAVYLRGRLDVRDLGAYIGAQLLAGLAAAGVALFLFHGRGEVPAAPAGRELWAAVVVEILFTFGLAYTVLNVATSKDHPVNSFYGLAIGLVVVAGASAVGGLSGGAFNPAVGLGVCLAGLASWGMLWVYLVATLLGGAGAAYAFRYLNPDDLAPAAPTEDTKAASGRRVPAARRS